jgi:hypothetical protein
MGHGLALAMHSNLCIHSSLEKGGFPDSPLFKAGWGGSMQKACKSKVGHGVEIISPHHRFVNCSGKGKSDFIQVSVIVSHLTPCKLGTDFLFLDIDRRNHRQLAPVTVSYPHTRQQGFWLLKLIFLAL